MTEYTKTYVGACIVVGSGDQWYVIDRSGGGWSRPFATRADAVRRASERERAGAARVEWI